jgi:hypothetical protein
MGYIQHWASIPKVVGSIPTVAGHIFQLARPVWIYTQSNITNILIHLSTQHQLQKKLYTICISMIRMHAGTFYKNII